jgi:phosphonate transport system ATP-binding protein
MPSASDSDAGSAARSAAAGPALSIEHVTKRYGARTVLDDVTLSIAAGEHVALIGASGSGKTTLLRLLAGLAWPDAGRVLALGHDTARLSGRALRETRRNLGLLLQTENLVPGLRVAHNVLLGRLGHWSALRALWSLVVPQELERAREALRRVELEERLWSLPGELSGGQQQRVAIARLLVQAPAVWLADEPTASLDVRLGNEVLDLLVAAARERGATLVVSLHALELLGGGRFDRVVALREGKVAWQGRAEELDSARVRALYGSLAPFSGPAGAQVPSNEQVVE